jgi:hypothetical protein
MASRFSTNHCGGGRDRQTPKIKLLEENIQRCIQIFTSSQAFLILGFGRQHATTHSNAEWAMPHTIQSLGLPNGTRLVEITHRVDVCILSFDPIKKGSRDLARSKFASADRSC